MPENEFSLTRIFWYKDRIYESLLIRENTGKRKPVFWHILRSIRINFNNDDHDNDAHDLL